VTRPRGQSNCATAHVAHGIYDDIACQTARNLKAFQKLLALFNCVHNRAPVLDRLNRSATRNATEVGPQLLCGAKFQDLLRRSSSFFAKIGLAGLNTPFSPAFLAF
jgi:hypothetical protein